MWHIYLYTWSYYLNHKESGDLAFLYEEDNGRYQLWACVVDQNGFFGILIDSICLFLMGHYCILKLFLARRYLYFGWLLYFLGKGWQDKVLIVVMEGGRHAGFLSSYTNHWSVSQAFSSFICSMHENSRKPDYYLTSNPLDVAKRNFFGKIFHCVRFTV